MKNKTPTLYLVYGTLGWQVCGEQYQPLFGDRQDRAREYIKQRKAGMTHGEAHRLANQLEEPKK